MYAMKCDRCGNYFDCNQLRLRGGNCGGEESFGKIIVMGEHNHCCSYDLCDDCVKQLFDFMHDTSKIVGGDANGNDKRNADIIQE